MFWEREELCGVTAASPVGGEKFRPQSFTTKQDGDGRDALSGDGMRNLLRLVCENKQRQARLSHLIDPES